MQTYWFSVLEILAGSNKFHWYSVCTLLETPKSIERLLR